MLILTKDLFLIVLSFLISLDQFLADFCSDVPSKGSKMKALSVKQPWAKMIASGAKTIETRKWCTEYRGPLLIVSSKAPRIEPAGYALAVVKLIDCRQMTKADQDEACCEYYSGAFSWVLTNIKLIKPFAVTGHLGLYEVAYNPNAGL